MVWKIIRYFFFLSIGLLLFYGTLQSISTHDWKTMRSLWTWQSVGVVSFCTLLSHTARLQRWRLLLAAADAPTSFAKATQALFMGYAVNLVVPRLGELTRCWALNPNRDTTYTTRLLGTVVVERITDIGVLFVLLCITWFTQWQTMQLWLVEQVWMPWWQAVSHSRGLLIGLSFAGFGLLVLLGMAWQRWGAPLRQHLLSFAQGLWSFVRLHHPLWFWGYTLCIWIGYFGMTYGWLLALRETAHLGWEAGLFLLAVGSLARSIPIQGGGLGAYHWLFSHAIALWDVPLAIGIALAIVNHGFQTLLYVFIGLVSYGFWIKDKLKNPA